MTMITEKQMIYDIEDMPDLDEEGDNNESKIFKDTNLLNYIDDDKDDISEMQEINDLIGDALSNKTTGNEIKEKFKDVNEHLAREKERYNSQLETMTKLKEDFEILKSKCGKIEAEKENVELHKNTLTFKLQGYIDQVEEKDEIIKHLEIKLESKSKEIEDFKKVNSKLLSQIKDSDEKEVETKSKIALAKGNIDLQQELSILKKKVRLQDYALKQLKTLGLLHEGSKEEIKTSYEDRVKRAFTDIESYSDIEDSEDSLYLSESEVEQLVSNQRMIHERIESELAQKRKMREEMEELRYKLNKTLEQANPDIKEITTALVEEKVRDMKELYERERERLLLDLGNRVQKVCDLEMEIDMMRDEYRRLERSLTREDMLFFIYSHPLKIVGV